MAQFVGNREPLKTSMAQFVNHVELPNTSMTQSTSRAVRSGVLVAPAIDCVRSSLLRLDQPYRRLGAMSCLNVSHLVTVQYSSSVRTSAGFRLQAPLHYIRTHGHHPPSDVTHCTSSAEDVVTTTAPPHESHGTSIGGDVAHSIASPLMPTGLGPTTPVDPIAPVANFTLNGEQSALLDYITGALVANKRVTSVDSLLKRHCAVLMRSELPPVDGVVSITQLLALQYATGGMTPLARYLHITAYTPGTRFGEASYPMLYPRGRAHVDSRLTDR
jgi:hypothetical protein